MSAQLRGGALAVVALLVLTGCNLLPGQAQGDHLERVRAANTLWAFTDPAYPPQSFIDEDGAYAGFDIDVTREIARRLGVENVDFTTPRFSIAVAGNWAGRFDIAVGSITITEERKSVLDFTQVYYYTPAQLATHPNSGISSVDDFAGRSVCAGEDTTYVDWLESALNLPPEAGEVGDPPDNVTVVQLPTDVDCPTAWNLGRFDFDGWLTAKQTAQQAVDDGLPVVLVGDPVFFEPLAVAFDKSVTDNDSLVAEVDRIIGEMHSDGTLTQLSEKWYGIDITKGD
jgi:polar amino acid transport system substrate-binding protein